MSELVAVEASEEKARNTRLWMASALVVLLVIMSWMKDEIFFRIYHLAPSLVYPEGQYVYVVLRLALTASALGLFFRFRTSRGTGDPRKVNLLTERTFDPLMGLRAFACLLVVLGHYFVVLYPPDVEPTGLKQLLLTLFSASPWGGVWIFFTLSGYLMGKGFTRGRYTLDEPGVALYVRNRMLRILPIYLVANFLLCVWKYPEIFGWKSLWMALEILIFDYRGELPINPIGALWSVSTEVQFYLLVPLVLVVLLAMQKKAAWIVRTMPIWLLMLGVGWRTLILRHFQAPYYGSWGYSPLLPNLDLFVVGLSLNFVQSPRRFAAKLSTGAWAQLLLALTAVFYIAISTSTFLVTHRSFGLTLPRFWTFGPAIGCAFASAFIYLAEIRGRFALPAGVRGRLLLGIQHLGLLTYCVYVFHSETLSSLRRLLPLHATFGQCLAFFPVAFAAVLAVATIFHRFLEEPYELRKKVSA